jgi:prepilin-type N-terminal cleavage/methylation domain-containing protein
MKKMIIKQKAMPTLPTGRQVGRQGFSFLELMITIAIAGIMTAAMLVSMNAQRDKKAVEGAAREVAAVIREIQNYALTGKNLSSHPNCTYDFSWSGTDYSVNNCDTRNYTLKNGVSFNNNGSFSFSATFANLSTSSTVDMDLLKNSSHYHVCIYKSGVISESLVACP